MHYFKLCLVERQIDHVHNFADYVGNFALGVTRSKFALFNDSLVEQVLCMKNEHVARYINDLSHLFEIFLL